MNGGQLRRTENGPGPVKQVYKAAGFVSNYFQAFSNHSALSTLYFITYERNCREKQEKNSLCLSPLLFFFATKSLL